MKGCFRAPAGWSANLTLPYKIREELPVNRELERPPGGDALYRVSSSMWILKILADRDRNRNSVDISLPSTSV